MLELTGVGSVRSLGWLYWLLAAVAIYLAISKGKSRRAKIVWTVVAIVVFGFLPAQGMIEKAQRDAYAREAWAYFKKKCETEAGEKIYKTYTGVKSVLVVKPLPPATEKDLYDQFWYGDPYSDATPWEQRAHTAAAALTTSYAPVSEGKHGPGFDFVESVVSAGAEGSKAYVKYFFPNGSRDSVVQSIGVPVSRFTVSWDDISTLESRRYWVAGSRLRVIDLSDNSIVAERVGYFIEAGFGSTAGQRRPWLTSRGPNTTCPYAHDWSDRWFLLKVLGPHSEASNGK
jgi:hypothetical protein